MSVRPSSALIFVIILLWSSGFCGASIAQSFSGQITYQLHYEYKKGGDRSPLLNRTEGDREVFYTDGCNQRTDYFYKDQILHTTFYHCETGLSYLYYPGVKRVLQHDIYLIDNQTKIISYEKEVLDVLGVSCDHLIVEYTRADHQFRSEFFLSSQYHLEKQAAPTDHRLIIEDESLALSIPMARVQGEGTAFQAAEAIAIEPLDSISWNVFALPPLSQPVLNGLAIDQPPQPKKGYAWWQNKLQSSLRFPRNARKERLDGRVMVMFTITETGEMEDVEIVNNENPIFSDQVLNYFNRSSVKWIAGQKNGKPVTSTLILPLTFLVTP